MDRTRMNEARDQIIADLAKQGMARGEEMRATYLALDEMVKGAADDDRASIVPSVMTQEERDMLRDGAILCAALRIFFGSWHDANMTDDMRGAARDAESCFAYLSYLHAANEWEQGSNNAG